MAKIIDKGADGSGKRWVVRYREPGGRGARQREKSFDRKRDAVDFATRVEHDKRTQVYIDPDAGKVTLRVFVQEWLETISVSDGTWESYERIWRLHVLPQLGRKLLSQVTAADIEKLYNLWRAQGAEPNTIESRRIALSSAFTHAARHKRIATNPAKEALAPEHHIVPVDERALPSLEEVSAIAESIGPRLGPAIWMMASCGLRIGETLGLSSQDFDTGMLRLRRQVVRTNARGGRYAARYAPLKHRKEGEWRDVPLPESAFPLAPYFPILSESETIPYPDLLRKSWNRAIRRLGMRPYTPHDLRHKWATVTLTNGVSIHEVSRWLGHRSIKVTVDRYGHLTQDGRERCRQVVSAVYADHVPSGLRPARTCAAPGAELVLG
ncbi:site-specific integrase [Streptomyces diacarni]|uniref:tyrosine-type recombinase/integrase n=1 Tax=Streptomyces diacarni TaxID=2800381 RepID=UPI0033F052FE